MDAEAVPEIFLPAVTKKTPQTSKNTIKVNWMLPVEQDEFITRMSLLLGVRKGAVAMLAIGMLQKFEEKNRALLLEISRSHKRRAEVRKLFARYGVDLKPKDFIL